jgi:DNA repair exonuclease SbcCD nuclease subunit
VIVEGEKIMAADFKIMVTGDLHLGRHPTKIPEDIDGEFFSPGRVWQNIVTEACRRGVDAVVITGDVIDRGNKFYEAWGPFESGLQRLNKEGIPVYAVAGNHDSGVLEGFLDSMGDLNCKLIGRDGSWERVLIKKDGEALLNLDGWSYPARHVRENPVDKYDLKDSQSPTLGILHTEFDRASGHYAPTSAENLKQLPVDGWLLGHIHKPELHCENPLILNSGSPQPLTPTETGFHGPWELKIYASGDIEARQVPLATIEYVNLEVDVGKLKQPENLISLIKNTLVDWREGTEELNGELRAYSVRLKLSGETEFQREFNNLIVEKRDSFRFGLDEIQVFIEKIKDNTQPCLDLKELSEGQGPVGRLAELVLKIKKDAEALPDELLEKVKSSLDEISGKHYYNPLRSSNRLGKLDRDQIADIVCRQGYLLIRELLSQKEQSQ